MVLRKYIKILSVTLVYVFFTLLFSCEDIHTLLVDCSKCKKEEPSEAEVGIKITQDYVYKYGQIHINVYEGPLEDSILFKTLTISNDASCTLPLNKTYTFTASYLYPGKHYIAVNSVTPRVIYVDSQCDEPCYSIYDNTINLRLKYTK
jgi:hypothetical protein